MRRRTVLATSTTLAAAPLAALAGCVDDGSEAGESGPGSPADDTDTPTETATPVNARDPDEYDTCSRMVIPRSSFPTPAQEEIRAAIEEGGYETDEMPYLPNLIDVESSSVEVEDTTYRVHVESDEKTRIELEETTPTRGERSFAVENDADEPLSATITVERDSGEELLSESVELNPEERVDAGTFDREFGDYVLIVETEAYEETHSFEERESAMPLEGVVLYADEAVPIPRSVMDMISCRDIWDTRG